jgi:hypothetical protein
VCVCVCVLRENNKGALDRCVADVCRVDVCFGGVEVW